MSVLPDQDMNRSRIFAKVMRAACVLLLCVAMRAPSLTAQGLDPSALLQKQATDTWPTYNGDYSGKRYSPLDQINASNVNQLTLAWIYRTHGQAIKASSLEVNGILYFTVPDNVYAIDARFGLPIWHFEHKVPGDHIGHRGVAMLKDKLYFETSDAHLLCLNAKDGKLLWDIVLADASGDSTDIRGILTSVDPDTGAVQWHWYTEPDPGQPGSETWPDTDAL